MVECCAWVVQARLCGCKRGGHSTLTGRGLTLFLAALAIATAISITFKYSLVVVAAAKAALAASWSTLQQDCVPCVDLVAPGGSSRCGGSLPEG